MSAPVNNIGTAITGDLASLVNLTNTLAKQLSTAPFSALSGSGSDLWPVKNQGVPNRFVLPGTPMLEKRFHTLMTQGNFHEPSLGAALSLIQHKKLDLDEKIQHYLDLNRLASSSQLTHIPRVIKLVADSEHFLQVIFKYVSEIQDLLTSLQAVVNMTAAVEARMKAMIQQNLTALANLMHEICNWNLPQLPSLLALSGMLHHWAGFQFTKAGGFNFNPNLSFDFNFHFTQCNLLPSNLLKTLEHYLSAYGLTFGGGGAVTAVPFDGSIATVSSVPGMSIYTTTIDDNVDFDTVTSLPTASYALQLRTNTTTPVVDSTTYITQGSLPAPASVLSDFELSPTVYAANVVSTVADLLPAVIQPGDADFTATTPSAGTNERLRQLLVRYVTLDAVVQSGYEPNLTAAWLLYLQLNHDARMGTWLTNFAAVYNAQVLPSLNYLSTNPVPWNNVYGGTAVQAGPSAIPLIAALQGDITGNLHWRLSYLEASLLGYGRSTTWDASADITYLSFFTGSGLDYAVTLVDTASTQSLLLGTSTALYPVRATYPQSIATKLIEVVLIAQGAIASASSYESVRPQNRYTYDTFAQAHQVDRFTQFWRDFNSNLGTLLSLDAYTLARVVSYVDSLDSILNPLTVSTAYAAVKADCASRDRTWTPGSTLLSIPKAIGSALAVDGPTDQTNGWTTGSFDSVAFLARPDVQALPIPTQVAMLRTSQSYDVLRTIQTNLNDNVSTALTQATATLNTVAAHGWSSSASAELAVGSESTTASFDTLAYDSEGYATDPSTIIIQQTGVHMLHSSLSWDPTGTPGVRMASLLHNGVVAATATATAASDDPFTTAVATTLSVTEGDTLEIVVSHNLASGQIVLPGASFTGLLDPGSSPSDAAPTQAVGGSVGFIAAAAVPVLAAVSIGSGGAVRAIDPTATAIPMVDGVTLSSAAAAASVQVGTAYGAVFTAPEGGLIPGSPLYAGAEGVLTSSPGSMPWTVYVGKAITATTFLFQPHIPLG